jgi:hypothetical protein
MSPFFTAAVVKGIGLEVHEDYPENSQRHHEKHPTLKASCTHRALAITGSGELPS